MGRGGIIVLAMAIALLAAQPLVLAGQPKPPEVADAPFSPNVRVNSGNPTYLYQVEPTMAINSQGRLFVGWKEAFTHNGGGQRVSFSYSADGGATWAPNAIMPLHHYSMQSDPWLTVTANDRVFFGRIEYDNANLPGGVAFTDTTDGVTWGTTQLFDDAPQFADKQTHAHDAAGNIYMVWNSDAVGSYQLKFTRSNDRGVTWTPELVVPDDTNGHLGGFVRIAPNGSVLATWWSWLTQDVWFDRSLDGGVTWGTDVRVNDVAGSADSPLPSDPVVLPAMAVAANGTIYTVWNDYRNARPGGTPNGDMDIMFSRSSDGGATWSPARQLNDDTTIARQWMPDLALDPNGGVHVAWMDRRMGSHNVYYVNSTDGGTTWGPNLRVTDAPTPATFTRPGDYLAIESDGVGNIFVVWTDGRRGDLDIYFAKLAKSSTMTVDSVPAGRTLEVNGVARTAPYTFDCQLGLYYTVAAPTPQVVGLTRFQFDIWSDAGAQTHQVLCELSATSTYVATFVTEHEVTLTTSPTGLELVVDGATVAAPTISWWQEGSVHAVGAPSPQGDATTRYVFDSWSDGGGAVHYVLTTAPLTLTAFYHRQFALVVQSTHGTVSCDVVDCWYGEATNATFSITRAISYGNPGTRYVFTGWAGDSSAGTTTASLAMDAPHLVTATWDTEYELTIISPYGTPIGAGWHGDDDLVSVSIDQQVTVNGTTYRFVDWTGDATRNTTAFSLVMSGPKTIRANWEPVPPSLPDTGPGSFVWWPWLVLVAVLLIPLLLFGWRRRRKDDETPPPPPA